jgi:hypothetical protein
MKLTNEQIQRAMLILGLAPNDFRAVEQAPSFEAGQQMLAALKERAKKQFRKVAMELHPDRTNNDPAKTDDFKLVSAVVEDIEKLVFGRPQPPPQMRQQQMRVVFVRMNVGFGFSSSTTTTTTYGGWGF